MKTLIQVLSGIALAVGFMITAFAAIGVVGSTDDITGSQLGMLIGLQSMTLGAVSLLFASR